jgi:hypothetical protein
LTEDFQRDDPLRPVVVKEGHHFFQNGPVKKGKAAMILAVPDPMEVGDPDPASVPVEEIVQVMAVKDPMTGL